MVESSNFQPGSMSQKDFAALGAQFQEAEHVTHIAFNHDQDVVVVGTNKGFVIYTIDPFCFRIYRAFEGGVRHTQIVGRSNVLLLIPSGLGSKFSSKTIVFWDEKVNKQAGIIRFEYEILACSTVRKM